MDLSEEQEGACQTAGGSLPAEQGKGARGLCIQTEGRFGENEGDRGWVCDF